MKNQQKQMELLGSQKKQTKMIFDDGIESIPFTIGTPAQNEKPSKYEPPKPIDDQDDIPTMQLEKQECRISGNVIHDIGNNYIDTSKTNYIRTPANLLPSYRK